MHDVMPATLDRCLGLLEYLDGLNVTPVTLLVVPGHDWSDRQLATLEDLQRQGLILAGHGWYHEVSEISSLYHRLHSLLLSRRAAEHLSLNGQQIQQLIGDCFAWFTHHGFKPPQCYVPPAWALGAVQRGQLKKLPFRYYEVLSGVLDAHSGQLKRLPLTGYEADTAWRAASLRPWNRWNEWRASHDRPLRIGLHPFDREMRLAAQLHRQLVACDRFISYPEVFSDASPESGT